MYNSALCSLDFTVMCFCDILTWENKDKIGRWDRFHM